MNKVGSYKINKEEKFIIEYYYGQIEIEDVMFLKDTLSKEESFNASYSIIHDFRNSNLKLSQEDLKNHLEFVKKHPTFLGERDVAFLTSRPNEVVLTTLFSMLAKNKILVNFEIFTTINAASMWLKIKATSIQKALDEIKTQPNILYK